MKKIYFTIALGLLAIGVALANDKDTIIKPTDLPQRAQQFIKRYYSMDSVLRAVHEEDFLAHEYKVWLKDGVHIEFSQTGDWTDVKCSQGSVPSEIVPAPIALYVAQHHAGSQVVRIERDKQGYEVVLTDHSELKFNTRFKLVEVD